VLPGSIPRIIVGTARMGSPLPDSVLTNAARRRAFDVLDGYLDVGCSALDLAASYQMGGTERLVGAWIASRRNRERLFLISKGGLPYPIVRTHRLDPVSLSADLHASLRRLHTEQIDLYLLHRDDDREPLESILETMTTFQRQGKVAAWGVSNWSHPRVRALASLAEARGSPAPSASSPHFSLVDWVKAPWSGSVSIAGDANREGRAYYEATQLPVLAWSSLGSGFLSHARGGGGVGSSGPRAYESPANFARRERADLLANRRGVTSVEIALAYLFAQKFPVFAIVAASSPEKMKRNLEATRLHLSASEVRWLESGDGTPPS
jgi:aryl-alcohol dehydrogenase-like predicted oxidoreductase